jgi:predicted permease
MRWTDKLRLRARSLFRRSRVNADLKRELKFHLESQIDELMASGLSADEARTAALRTFGGVAQVEQDCREKRGLNLLDQLRQDARYAARALTRHPGFTFVAITTLALGIGANTAIFSVVNGVLLKPLPYADPEQLVTLMANVPASESRNGVAQRTGGRVNVAELTALEGKISTLSHLAFLGEPALMTMISRGETTHIQGISVAPRLFELLGASPLLGRTIGRAEETPDAEGAIVLSYTTWRRFFEGDTRVIGETIRLANSLASPGQGTLKTYTVVGVMPDDFAFGGTQVQFWVPTAWTARTGGGMIARLAPGANRATAGAEIDGLLRGLHADHPKTTYEFAQLQDQMVAPVRPALRVLMGAVAFLLLIACVNLANLLLARGTARQREIAIRMALGAGRARVIRQLLTESVILSLLGGIAGTLLGLGGLRLLRLLATTFTRMDLGVNQPIPRLEAVSLDGTVLAFTLAASLAAGLLFGVAPALQHARAERLQSLREGASSAASGFGLLRRHRLRGVLVITEIALAMMLLAGGGLLIHSFIKLSSVDPGYNPARLLTFQVALPPDRYTPARLDEFAERVTASLRRMPGVEAAAYARQLPMVLLFDSYAFGRSPTPAGSRPGDKLADTRLVSRDYLRTIGIRLVAGRGFDERDGAGQPQVLIVNQALARREFPNEDPIGRLVYTGPDQSPWTIIGVVEDVRQFGLDRTPTPQFFADFRQWREEGNRYPLGSPYYLVRTTTVDDAALLATIQSLARGLDTTAGVYNVATMDAIMSNSTSRPRMYATLLGIFAGVGACLAVIGLYGVMAYAVAQRTREIAIRVALGARRADVMGLVLGQSLLLIAIGIVLGIGGAAMVTRYLEAMLYGLTPFDTTTFVGVSLLFAMVALIASYVPARRATRVNPLIALRYD